MMIIELNRRLIGVTACTYMVYKIYDSPIYTFFFFFFFFFWNFLYIRLSYTEGHANHQGDEEFRIGQKRHINRSRVQT